MKKLLKFAVLFSVLPFILFLQTGLRFGFNTETFQAVMFSLVFILSWKFPVFRKSFFIISGFLIAAMAPFYILNMMHAANLLGSTGVGFVLIILLTWLPQFIKKGYLEKL